MTANQARPSGARDDTGAALLLVVGVGAVLAMLMSMLVVVSINGMRQARDDSDWNASLAAAYAGIDDYQSRLSADPTYYRFGNAAAPFSATSTLTAPPTANSAFGVGTAGTWADVAGSAGRAQYRYEVDSSKYSTNGRIRVRATGRVGEATRTIIADLKQQGFIDFLYFTDYEASDPEVAGTSDSTCFTSTTPTRLRYSWESRPTTSTNKCKEIAFGPADVLNGPVHSNDTIRGCGATFTGVVTTGNTVSPYFKNMNASGGTSGCAAMDFELAGSPSYNGTIGMPATNSELKKETRSDLTATDVPRPGCLYTGPTQFTFFSDGTVNIKSPFTKATRIGNASSSTGSTDSDCGAISALQSPAGATIPIPDNNVLYVQNVPAVTTDVNYWATANPAGFTCTSTGTASERGWTFGTGAALVGYPRKTGSSSSTEAAPAGAYGCRTGDVFVKGTFNGATTLAAENYIYVVGDIEYGDAQDDILGLVGNNAIFVYNPVNASGNNVQGNLPSTAANRTIEAAILSVAHTFQVQNYDSGGVRGTLHVLGAIAQKYRGPVGTGSTTTLSTGYAKSYVYDERFRLKAPPKYLNPITTTYGVTTWVETAAAWSADGTAR